MIKLFIQNKFTEIANFLYRMWNDDMPCRYFSIWLMTMIPGSIVVYNVIMIFVPTAIKVSMVTVLFAGLVYYTGGLLAIGILHAILYQGYKWIKHNIELARKGIKVKADWKKL